MVNLESISEPQVSHLEPKFICVIEVSISEFYCFKWVTIEVQKHPPSFLSSCNIRTLTQKCAAQFRSSPTLTCRLYTQYRLLFM